MERVYYKPSHRRKSMIKTIMFCVIGVFLAICIVVLALIGDNKKCVLLVFQSGKYVATIEREYDTCDECVTQFSNELVFKAVDCYIPE